MVEQANIPSIERSTFFDGQRLTARDLTELQREHRELRWLHNRSLHGWGIGLGLAVTGERGGTTVVAGPGYGVDCLGREIIMTEQRTISVPADHGANDGSEASYYLVASYQVDDEQAIAEQRAGVCAPPGTVRLAEAPRIGWKSPEHLNEGYELILAQAAIRNCRLAMLSDAVRRYARPSDHPYMAAGQTEPGNTGWREWKAGEQTLGVFAEIDTSAARFKSTPHYFAQVPGERHVVTGGGQVAVLMRTLGGVVEPEPARFILQLRVQFERSTVAIANLPLFIEGLKWHVVWTGIEA